MTYILTAESLKRIYEIFKNSKSKKESTQFIIYIILIFF